MDVSSIISKLITSKREWQYWDFKQQWYSKEGRANFIHDLLCLSNAIHKGDRHLIIGVSDSCEILGVYGDSNRKRQNDVIDTLRSVPFSQEKIPEEEDKG
ncbi:MAG: putative DNA binding domain-containing protein [Rikenellaceae bacterium]